MYIPKLYREEDRERVLAFLKENNFPVLVTHGQAGLTATHLAVEVVETGAGGLEIHGHLARANGQWKDFGVEDVLLVFQGPHAYISPTWYGHVNVPTWNYTMVHVYGKARLMDDGELKAALARLIARQEAGSWYRLEGLEPEFVDREMKGALGFVVDVSRLEAAYKLSQNRNDADHAAIIGKLEARGDEASARLAAEMRRNRPPA